MSASAIAEMFLAVVGTISLFGFGVWLAICAVMAISFGRSMR